MMMNPPHLDELPREKVMIALDLSVAETADRLGMSRAALYRVLNGRAAVRPDLSLRPEMAGVSTARAWLVMQVNHNLAQAKQHLSRRSGPYKQKWRAGSSAEPFGNVFTFVLPPSPRLTFGEKTNMIRTKPSDRADLLKQVERWAGSEAAALAWYRSERIPSLGDRTPEELVNQGRSDEVRAYLAHLADGGYA